MAILLDEKTECMVQGITGREARIRVSVMKEYGSRIVCGVTPGRGGASVDGIPVYDTVQEALEKHPGATVSSVFVPAHAAKDAAFEAMDAGIELVVLHPERVPQQDMLEVIQRARDTGCLVIGPNSIGMVSPGRAILGMIGGTPELARIIFHRGPCGVISRSGGHTTTTSFYLTQAGLGQTTAIAIGGDPFVGATFADLLPLFEKDPETEVVVAFGEPGTMMEEEAGQLVAQGKFTKPLVFYLAGKYVVPEVRFGHAGAIVSRGRGTVEEKADFLGQCGVVLVDHLADIGETVKRLL